MRGPVLVLCFTSEELIAWTYPCFSGIPLLLTDKPYRTVCHSCEFSRNQPIATEVNYLRNSAKTRLLEMCVSPPCPAGQADRDLHGPVRHLQEHSQPDEGRVLQAESGGLRQGMGGKWDGKLVKTVNRYVPDTNVSTLSSFAFGLF